MKTSQIFKKALVAIGLSEDSITDESLKPITDAVTTTLAAERQQILEEGFAKAKSEMSEKLEEANKQLVALKESQQQQITKTLDNAANTLKSFDDVAVELFEAYHAKFQAMLTEHTQRLNAEWQAKYDALNESALTTDAASTIQTFINENLVTVLPEQKVIDAVKVSRLEKFYENVREACLISDNEIQSAIAAKLEMIDEKFNKLHENYNAVLAEKVDLQKKLDVKERREIVTEALKNIPTQNRRMFLESARKQDTAWLKENVDSLINEHSKFQEVERNVLVEKIAQDSIPLGASEQQILSENFSQSNDIMSFYAAAVPKR